ncbi:MAG: hypothetical protein H6Q33_4001 [Deltaproteobacteria bacterium]|nr:hypothetical protein [Deltaproteobacteria bacterium]
MITDQIAEEPPRGGEPGQPHSTDVRSTLMDLEQQARTLIRQRPVVAVLAAVGVGYLVARLVARVLR